MKPALGTLALLIVAMGCERNPPPPPELLVEDERSYASAQTGSIVTVEGGLHHDSSTQAARTAPAVSEHTMAALEELGYLPTTPTDNPETRGVTVREPDAWQGLNLFSSRHRASARLIDLDGRVIHRWEAEDADERSWMHVEPFANGDILAISKDRDLARHAWDSSLIWRRRLRVHHDVAIREDGRIYALTRRHETFTHRGDALPAIGDGIAVLSPDGRIERRVRLLPILRHLVSRVRLARLRTQLDEKPRSEVLRAGGVADLLHANSIALVQQDIPGVAPAGSLLLSLRSANRIAIVDAALERVLWSWGRGELQAQHDATQLGNGNLLIFDNGRWRERSRAIEVDPTTGEIVWSYSHDELYTPLRGGAQRLPNENVLITEADSGRAIEVARDGRLLWEFWNPDVRGRGARAERATIYRLNRFSASFFEPL